MNTKLLIALGMAIVASGCLAQDGAVAAQVNHPFTKVDIGYQSEGCSFQFSPVDFCDKKHRPLIDAAIKQQQPNYDQHYILLTMPEWPEYHQRSVVAIDATSGVVYPLPIDAYSGPLDTAGNPTKDGMLTFSRNSDEVCIEGAILAYKAIDEGRFCFKLQGNRFVGHRTAYME